MVSLNYAPETTGVGLYSGELAQTLAARGHSVSVLCGNPHFPQWKLYDGYRAFHWMHTIEENVTVTRCPIYIPAKIGGGNRLMHYASFLMSAALPGLRAARGFRPDLVIAAAPSLMSAPLALAIARISGAASWLHIQDFEVEAAFATQHLDAHGMLARLARGFERRMLKSFDRISSISPEMCDKTAEKGVAADIIYEMRNWASIDTVRPQISSTYRDRWNIGDRHVALYSGSIGRKQGIETIAEAARLLDRRDDLVFVICGNGPGREKMEAAAAGLRNIQFHDLQLKENLGELLNLASIHLLPQRADAADLVLPSKLTNMLASGRPTVAGVRKDRGLAREVEGAGLIHEPEDPVAMAIAIERLLDDADLRARFGAEARRKAEQLWDREVIIDKFEEAARELVGIRRRPSPDRKVAA